MTSRMAVRSRSSSSPPRVAAGEQTSTESSPGPGIRVSCSVLTPREFASRRKPVLHRRSSSQRGPGPGGDRISHSERVDGIDPGENSARKAGLPHDMAPYGAISAAGWETAERSSVIGGGLRFGNSCSGVVVARHGVTLLELSQRISLSLNTLSTMSLRRSNATISFRLTPVEPL